MKISLLSRTAFYSNNPALMLFLLVRSSLSFLRKTLFTYELYNMIKRYCWQFNIWQTLSLPFPMSPNTGSTNPASNNFEIFMLLKDNFCSVPLSHREMLKESPSSGSHASSSFVGPSELDSFFLSFVNNDKVKCAFQRSIVARCEKTQAIG